MIIIKNQIGIILKILIHQQEGDADDAILRKKIQQKTPPDADDAILSPKITHLPPLAEKDDIAAKNHALKIHLPQQRVILENLHHHNVPGEKDLNPILHQKINVMSFNTGKIFPGADVGDPLSLYFMKKCNLH